MKKLFSEKIGHQLYGVSFHIVDGQNEEQTFGELFEKKYVSKIFTPPKTDIETWKYPRKKKENHLQGTNFWGSKYSFSGGVTPTHHTSMASRGIESWCRARTVQTIRPQSIPSPRSATTAGCVAKRRMFWWGTRDANEVWLPTGGSVMALRAFKGCWERQSVRIFARCWETKEACMKVLYLFFFIGN